jgi:hypothetical protein
MLGAGNALTREDDVIRTHDLSRPAPAPRRTEGRAVRWTALVASIVGLVLLVSVEPAAAAWPHRPYSYGTAPRVSEVRTVLAPTATFNNYDLTPVLCRSDNWISEYPTWTVKNVASTSAYVYLLKITYKPGRIMTIGGGHLIDGNGNIAGNYYNYLTVCPSGTKTWTFNKTVSFGSAGRLRFISLFNPGNYSEPANCINDAEVYFYLRPI